jgi:hypothetical protein
MRRIFFKVLENQIYTFCMRADDFQKNLVAYCCDIWF